MRRLVLAAAAVFTVFSLSGVSWGMDHSQLLQGPYKNGRAVTKDCLGCHEEQGRDFIKSAHWLWKGPSPHVAGLEKGVELGKRKLMNNF